MSEPGSNTEEIVNLVEAIPRDEWLRRYKERFMKCASLTDEEAQACVDAVCTGPDDDDGFIELSDSFEDDPEGAADEEMSYWEYDGE